jgi:hypothetical protein
MMTLCTAAGLTMQSGGVFLVTLRAREHLVDSSPWNMRPYYNSMKDRPSTLAMLEVLRTGLPAKFGSYDPQAWAQAMERPEFAAAFTAGMDCRGMLMGPAIARAFDFADRRAVLDIAGGSGIYVCALVARHPHLTGAVFEKSPVDRIAESAVAKQECGERVKVISGDMFKDDWPTTFDVHLMSNVLHDWDEPTVRDLLMKSYDALPTGGVLLIHQAFINEGKTGPLHVAEYSALLMQITEGKCYSVAEMRKYLNAAGFQWGGIKPTAVGRSVMIAHKE